MNKKVATAMSNVIAGEEVELYHSELGKLSVLKAPKNGKIHDLWLMRNDTKGPFFAWEDEKGVVREAETDVIVVGKAS